MKKLALSTLNELFAAINAAEGAKFAATMNDFVATITKLGENRRLEDLRCKE